jgi:4-carboxymuconolactone decarboxylase
VSAWTVRRDCLVGLAALAVLPDAWPRLARAVAGARRARLPRRALVELGLMLRLYAGYPAAIEFLRAVGRAWPARTGARPAASYEDWQAWRDKGERLCRRVYGESYPRLRAFMRALDPDLDSWMILEGYGKTLTRGGLTLAERELATVSALAALGWTRQLDAHLEGAERVGAPAAHVKRARTLGLRCRRTHRP